MSVLRDNPSLSDSSDEEDLIQRARNKDVHAFTVLFSRYESLIWYLLYHMIGHKETSEDLYQETFLRAWQALPSQNDPQLQFKAWLCRIATNLARDHLRRASRIHFLSIFAEEEGSEWRQETIAAVTGPEDSISDKMCIEEAFTKLPARSRMCLLLHDKGGFTQKEIASMLGISIGSVSAYISRGREQLYKYLSDANMYLKQRRK